ncbi:hypothetical protein [Chitinasiproducens palmae]|uniref:Lipoprotein n=1 Tax=Chitinasiproducens palmae TaxID=1770053 RepID=A0A1H2PNV8_9BURK|nr:hypothetical protein [Chitinasiproducens palmae]SDV48402.1 hypothetical protein SAMN05216551_10562 [Chitinasiproducens palmae]
MKKTLLLAALPVLALAGCGSAPPLFTSDGRPTTHLSCNSGGWADCDRQAQVACGSTGYDVLQRDDSAGRDLYVACRR